MEMSLCCIYPHHPPLTPKYGHFQLNSNVITNQFGILLIKLVATNSYTNVTITRKTDS